MLPRVAAVGPKNTFVAAFAALSLANCVLLAEVDYDLIPDEPAGNGGNGGGIPACSADEDCDDSEACTADACVSGTCVYTPLAEGTPCGQLCVTSGTCSANATCNEMPVVLDDGNACTTDACDETSGQISHTPVDIDDENSCTTDACDPSTGMITHEATAPGCLSWQTIPTTGAPSPRQQHSAVWTGSKMIIWGGSSGPADPPLNTGGIYDPATKTWSAVTTNGAPSGRHSHRAVWTGTKMLVWGGFSAGGAATGGGMYDPETDSWTAMTTSGEPASRIQHSLTWTGSVMVMFGGLSNNVAIAQGSAFDPTTNTWTNLPTAGQPMGRFNHTAVWTGERIIIWGGQNYSDWLWTGASYNATTKAWTGPTPGMNAPEAREQHSSVWTGSTMLVWGGWNGGQYLDTGAIFDPATSTWKTMNATGAPTGRAEQSGVWTGSSMVIWGGCGVDICGTLYGDGGIYTPDDSGGTWQPIPENAAMPPRRRHTTVWTGSSFIVWGGREKSGVVGTGGEAKL